MTANTVVFVLHSYLPQNLNTCS